MTEHERVEEIARRVMDGPVRDYTGLKGPCGCSERYCGYCRIYEGITEAIVEAQRATSNSQNNDAVAP